MGPSSVSFKSSLRRHSDWPSPDSEITTRARSSDTSDLWLDTMLSSSAPPLLCRSPLGMGLKGPSGEPRALTPEEGGSGLPYAGVGVTVGVSSSESSSGREVDLLRPRGVRSPTYTFIRNTKHIGSIAEHVTKKYFDTCPKYFRTHRGLTEHLNGLPQSRTLPWDACW